MPDPLDSIPKLETDHDALVALVVTVNFLKESQEKFHQEIKASIDDLKTNYASRLNKVEDVIAMADKVYIAKVEQDKRDSAFEKRITWLERISYIGIGLLYALVYYLHYFRK